MGSRYIADDHLLCTPSTWKTIIPFFLANYLAHVAAVKSIPGESIISTVFTLALAPIFPASGLSRGLDAITQCATRRKTPLDTACKAQALAVVIRDPLMLPDDELFADDLRTHAEETNPTLVVTERTPATERVFEISTNTSIHAAQPVGLMTDVNEPGSNAILLPISASSKQNPEKSNEIVLCRTKVRDESSAKDTGRNDQHASLERPGRMTEIGPEDLKQGTEKPLQDLEGQRTTGGRMSVLDDRTKAITRTDQRDATAKTVQENLRTDSQDSDTTYGPHPDIYRWRFLPTRHWYSLGGISNTRSVRPAQGLCAASDSLRLPNTTGH